MKYDFIGLETQVINGIKHPNLTLIGCITEDKYKFIVLADGEEIDYSINLVDRQGGFIINAPFSNQVKKIDVYVKIGNKKYLISTLKNSIIAKTYRKFAGIFSRVLHLIKAVFVTIYKGIKFFWKEYHFLVPPKMWGKYWRHFLQRIKERGIKLFNNPFDVVEYNNWINMFEKREDYVKQKYEPLISIVIPVYNIRREYLSKCLDSILNQSYTNFEICLADDCSTKKETIATLKEYEKKDSRIKVVYRKENGHISECTNSALKIAKGEFIALVDDDDELTVDALSEVVKALNKNKKIDYIYSDEDKIDTTGKRCDPHFKSDFAPDTLLSLNYMSHLSVIRKKLIDKVGGFEKGMEGAQDYDLFLKVTELTKNIYHIPKILYHWRMVDGSTSMTMSSKNYALEKGKKALENAMKRRKLDAKVSIDEKSLYYKVEYNIKKEPLVSIIIPTKDYPDVLETCLKSVYLRTKYKNFEVIVVNNNSEKQETFDLFNKYKKKYKNFKVYDANYEFNYSKINNDAVKHCKGEYICLLNNDTEIITDKWLTIMVGYAMQDHIGTVGAKLLYPDNTVQHGGIILGLGGVASHAYIGSSKDDLGMYGRLSVPYNYAGNTAACIVVSKKKFLEVGGLEEELKVAYNDVDFNIKLTEKGYYNLFVPQVNVYHFESKTRGLDTTPEKLERFNKEHDYMYNKWGKQIDNDKFYNPNFSKKGWFMLDNRKKK